MGGHFDIKHLLVLPTLIVEDTSAQSYLADRQYKRTRNFSCDIKQRNASEWIAIDEQTLRKAWQKSCTKVQTQLSISFFLFIEFNDVLCDITSSKSPVGADAPPAPGFRIASAMLYSY